jgi:hypothetical protein
MNTPAALELAASIFIWFSSSAFGYFVARWFCRKFLDRDDDVVSLGTVSSDDIMDFSDDDKPFVPVKIVKENGLHYAWFTNNNKFAGQAVSDAEIRLTVQDHLLDQLGLKVAYVYETPTETPVA